MDKNDKGNEYDGNAREKPAPTFYDIASGIVKFLDDMDRKKQIIDKGRR